MPQIAPVTLNNGQADILFEPTNIDRNGTAHLHSNASQPNLADHLSCSVTVLAASKSRRSNLKLVSVQSAIVDGLAVPVDKAYADVTYKIPDSWSMEVRARFAELVSSAIRTGITKVVMTEGKPIY